MESRVAQKKKPMVKPITILKGIGPKLVPFLQTCAIYFVLYPDSSRSNLIHLAFKCAPIISLCVFVLLHGMNLRFEYAYSRRILTGLIFSCVGDALLVYKEWYFEHGVLMFGIAHVIYTSAFGLRPFNLYAGGSCVLLGLFSHWLLGSSLNGIMYYLIVAYICLITFMLWRAIARIQLFDQLWTWTKLCSCFGAVCFVISDLLLALDRFRAPFSYSHQLIMVSYYTAQLLIALSVVDSKLDWTVNYRVIQETDLFKLAEEVRLLKKQVRQRKREEMRRSSSRECLASAASSSSSSPQSQSS